MSTTTTPLTNGTPSRNGAPSGNGTPAPAQDATPAPPLTPVITGEKAHDSRGRFTAGNKAARGNPFFRRCAQLRAQAVCEITADEMRALKRKLYGQAMEGDVAATVVLLGYLLGKPAKVVDPDAVDDDQWKRMRDVPSQEEFAVANISGIDTAAAVEKLARCREAHDPFDKQWRPGAGRVMDEMAVQRRRRK
jgi:hypothetical protein